MTVSKNLGGATEATKHTHTRARTFCLDFDLLMLDLRTTLPAQIWLVAMSRIS